LLPAASCFEHFVQNTVQKVVCLQAFEIETWTVSAAPNDFRYSVGQKRLYMFYVIDAVCLGNTNSSSHEKLTDSAYRRSWTSLSHSCQHLWIDWPHLATVTR
jgi:hypothetical protein